MDRNPHSRTDLWQVGLGNIGAHPHRLGQRDGVDDLARLDDRAGFAHPGQHLPRAGRLEHRVGQVGLDRAALGGHLRSPGAGRGAVFGAGARLRQRQRCARGFDLGCCGGERGLALLQLGFGDEAALAQRTTTLVEAAGLAQARFGIDHRRLRCTHFLRTTSGDVLADHRRGCGDFRVGSGQPVADRLGIEPREFLPWRDFVALVDQHLRDATADAEAQLDLAHLDVTVDFGRRIARPAPPSGGAADEEQDHRGDRQHQHQPRSRRGHPEPSSVNPSPSGVDAPLRG